MVKDRLRCRFHRSQVPGQVVFRFCLIRRLIRHLIRFVVCYKLFMLFTSPQACMLSEVPAVNCYCRRHQVMRVHRDRRHPDPFLLLLKSYLGVHPKTDSSPSPSSSPLPPPPETERLCIGQEDRATLSVYWFVSSVARVR